MDKHVKEVVRRFRAHHSRGAHHSSGPVGFEPLTELETWALVNELEQMEGLIDDYRAACEQKQEIIDSNRSLFSPFGSRLHRAWRVLRAKY